MKKILLIFLITSLFSISLSAKDKKVPDNVQKALDNAFLNSNSMGKHFMLGFPANDKDNAAKDLIGIYVASEQDGNFRVINELTGLDKIYPLTKGDVTRLTTKNGGATWEWENRVIGKAAPKGVEIVSEVPISVYVLMGKSYSSEGYLAIPTTAWDHKYIHCSFYDFNESRTWRTEFLIIASENNTKVKVSLKGMPIGAATADPNWKIGQTKSIKLNKYETYLVQGDGLTRGLFDLTGTEIVADKPIGLISSHERTMIPKNIVYNGRDNLLAMLAPVSRWGKEYYTVELDRGTDRGDYFRVVAAEDDTDLEITWWDKKTREQINQLSYSLKANEWIEYHTIDADYTTYQESIRGTSRFKANNPIIVMQYAYSAWWDSRESRFDPFYFPVTPKEQFTRSTIFQAPSNKSGNDYVENFFNIVAIGDTNDVARNEELLSSIKIDGKTVRSYMDEFITNRIPGTDIFWAVVNLAQGPHVIKGDTPFGAYIYGFGQYNSYAWPAAAAFRNLEIVDYEEPRTTIEDKCDRYNITAVERINYERNDTIQEDTKMSDYPFTIGEVTNFKNFAQIGDPRYFELHEDEDDPERKNGQWFGELDDSVMVYCLIEDMKQNASMTFSFVDQWENTSLDSIIYFAPGFEVSSTDFGQQRIKNMSDPKKITITNTADGSTTITGIEIKALKKWEVEGTTFELQNYDNEEIIIPYGGTYDIFITYTPEDEYYDKNPKDYIHKETGDEYVAGFFGDLNELVISTKCTEFVYPLIGQGVEPYIMAVDWDERDKPVGKDGSIICYPSKNKNKSYAILNWNKEKNRPGSMDLVVTGIDQNQVTDLDGNPATLDVYTLDNEMKFTNNAGILNFDTPITVKAGGQVYLDNGEKIFPSDENTETSEISSLCFTADVNGEVVRNVPFMSNAIKGDKIALWAYDVNSPGPQVNDLLWESRRVLSINDGSMGETKANGFISITNTGAASFKIKKMNLIKDADNNFYVDLPNFKYGTDEWQDLDITILPEASPDIDIDESINIYKELKVPVIFNPQSEYENQVIPFKVPTAALEFTYNSNAENGLTVSGSLEGSAHLPKINPTGAVFTEKTLVGNKSTETKFITIENPSESASLKIYAINWATPTQDVFNFIDGIGDPITFGFENINTPYFSIAPGESERIPLDFTPRVLGDNIEGIVVVSDAVTGNEPATFDELDSKTIEAIGPGTAIGLTPIGHDFGPILRCNEPNNQVEFLVSDEPFFVESITVTNADKGVYVIDNIKQYQGQTITNTEPLVIPVQFVPTNDTDLELTEIESTKDYQKSITVTGYFIIDGGNEPGEATAVIDGGVYKNIVNFALSNDFPDKVPGSNVTLHIDVTSGNFKDGDKSGNPQGLNLTELSFDLRYREREMSYIPTATVNSGLTVTVDEAIEDESDGEQYFNRKITVSGNISSDFRVSLDMLTQLKSFEVGYNGDVTQSIKYSLDKSSTEFTIEDQTLECVIPVGDTDELNPEMCLATQRFLTLSNVESGNSIKLTEQVINKELNFDYSLAFDSPTSIELINTEGEVVTKIIDQNKVAGEYNVSYDMESFGSGVYIIRLKTNNRVITKEFLLVK